MDRSFLGTGSGRMLVAHVQSSQDRKWVGLFLTLPWSTPRLPPPRGQSLRICLLLIWLAPRRWEQDPQAAALWPGTPNSGMSSLPTGKGTQNQGLGGESCHMRSDEDSFALFWEEIDRVRGDHPGRLWESLARHPLYPDLLANGS